MRCRFLPSKEETWKYEERALRCVLRDGREDRKCCRCSVGQDGRDYGERRCSACFIPFFSLALLRSSSYGGHHPSLGCRRYSCQACGLPSVARRQPSEGWWRWGESNPRPRQLQPNFYACIPPLISQGVCRRTGLSPSNRSVVRGRDARTERFKPSPAELCRIGLAGVRRATSGP